MIKDTFSGIFLARPIVDNEQGKFEPKLAGADFKFKN